MTQTRSESETCYINRMMMMSVFGTRYYDLGVGQSSNFGIGYYNIEAGPSSSNFGQEYYDLRTDPSYSYKHGRYGRGHREHNEYLYYEVPAAVPNEQDEQQQQEN
uniref:Uncharacterized protein n=1 Tax=Cucumis melo TaxID=3656 RepID=A0A9I9D8T2_CUCME